MKCRICDVKITWKEIKCKSCGTTYYNTAKCEGCFWARGEYNCGVFISRKNPITKNGKCTAKIIDKIEYFRVFNETGKKT